MSRFEVDRDRSASFVGSTETSPASCLTFENHPFVGVHREVRELNPRVNFVVGEREGVVGCYPPSRLTLSLTPPRPPSGLLRCASFRELSIGGVDFPPSHDSIPFSRVTAFLSLRFRPPGLTGNNAGFDRPNHASFFYSFNPRI